MPLIMLCGHPCSGKSRRAEELAKHFTAHNMLVQLINYDTLNIERDSMYKDSTSEKSGRGAMKTAVARFINQSRLVIADVNNDLKSVRYELYCTARECCTTHCVVYCDTPPDVCRSWNDARRNTKEKAYSTNIMDDVLKRLEVPKVDKRWDAPLFVVRPDEALPIADIAAALIDGKAAKASVATVAPRAQESNYLLEVDNVTQEISAAVMKSLSPSAAVPATVGDHIRVPHCAQTVHVIKRFSVAELNRLRRQFLKVAAMRPPQTTALIADTFVRFLNSLGKDCGDVDAMAKAL